MKPKSNDDIGKKWCLLKTVEMIMENGLMQPDSGSYRLPSGLYVTSDMLKSTYDGFYVYVDAYDIGVEFPNGSLRYVWYDMVLGAYDTEEECKEAAEYLIKYGSSIDDCEHSNKRLDELFASFCK